MKGILLRFLLRWAVCSLGLWIAAGFLNGGITFGGQVRVLLIAGVVLAFINALIKPLVVLLSLPAILFSLGLFMIIVNGLMIMLASYLYDPLQVSGFGAAMLAGVIIGVVNYLVTAIVEEL